MNSVLACTAFVTSATTPDKLTKGQLALYSSDGKIVTAATDIKKESRYHFAVGLGNSTYKFGVWINPNRATKYYEAYNAGAAKTISFSNVKVTVGDAYTGCQVAVVITTKPKNSFMADKGLITTAVVDLLPGETETAVKARIKAEIDKKIEYLNNLYGDGTLTTTPAAGTTITDSLNITGAAGFWFDVDFEFLISGTKTDNGAVVTPTGTQKQVALLEANEDVAAQGYNPNFIKAYDPYGNIFTADVASTYNMYAIHSRGNRNHPFNIDTLGMEVVQYIAFDSTGTATTLDAIIDALVGIPDETEEP